ncbi:MAG: hypothetical protein KKC01_02915 [Gammaproteobacteria bacterium]|nr:hypothetical protein [Gammaproteobacteria bacterium]
MKLNSIRLIRSLLQTLVRPAWLEAPVMTERAAATMLPGNVGFAHFLT